jgi:hypothetical protein
MPLIRDDDGGYLEIRGRGLLYWYNAEGRGYQIDSEMVASVEYDIAVYPSDVTLMGEGKPASQAERVEVLTRMRKLCEKGHVRIREFE